MLNAIEAVDWGALPGHPDWYEPDRVSAGLRALAGATNLVQAARADFLLGQQQVGRSLLADAAEHWRFEVRGCVAEGDDTAAFGTLAGRLPSGVSCGAELHVAGEAGVVVPLEVALQYPPEDGSLDACLRVIGRHPYQLPQGALLLPGRCR